MEKNKNYDNKDAAHGFFWGVWAPQILSIAVILLFSLCAVAIDYTLEKFLDLPWVSYATLFVSQLAFVIFIIIYNKKMNIDFFSAIKIKRKFNVWIALACVGIAVALVFLCAPFVNLFDFLLSKIGYVKSTELPIALDSVGALIFGLFIFAVVPATVEEVLFRGMITNGLLNSAQTKKKKILMIVLSGLIFAAIHLSLQQAIYPFVVGCILAVLLLLTDNLAYTIIVHFVSNVIVVVSSYINYGKETELSYTVGQGFGAFGLFVLALAIVGGLLFLIYYINKKSKTNQVAESDSLENKTNIESLNTKETVLEDKKAAKKDKVDDEQEKLKNDIRKQLMQNKLLFNILAGASAAVLIIFDFISNLNKG